MKGTVPHHDQPVNPQDCRLEVTVESSQQVIASGSSKVRTSAAFLGLAIASGILLPKGGHPVVAAELPTAEPAPTQQTSSNGTTPVQGNDVADSTEQGSEWQPSLLQTVSGLNRNSSPNFDPAEVAVDEPVKPEKSGEVELSQPEIKQPVAASDSFSQSTSSSATSLEPDSYPSLKSKNHFKFTSPSLTEGDAVATPQIDDADQTPERAYSTQPSADQFSGSTSFSLPSPSVIESDRAFPSESRVYQVGVGDTLDRIAQRHHVSVEEIIQANRLIDPNFIKVNQQLRIPQASSLSDPQKTASIGLSKFADLSISESSLATENSPLTSETPEPLSVRSKLAKSIAPSLIPSEIEGSVSSLTTPNFADLQSPSSVFSSTGKRQVSLSQLAALKRTGIVLDPSNSELTPEQFAEGEIPASDSSVPAKTSTPQEPSPYQAEPASKLYTDRLRADVERLRQEYRQQSSYQVVNVSLESQPEQAPVPLNPNVSTSEHRLQRINPEFNPKGYLRQKVNQTEKSLSAQQLAQLPQISLSEGLRPQQPLRSVVRDEANKSSVVATAPLGSNAFDPLNNPTLGRMVSPELPPLPGPDSYLPNGTTRFNGYIWPSKGVLTSGYGWRWGRMHRGIDIAAPIGTPIVAAAPGVVTYAGWNSGGYGNLVEISHPDGSLTVYAHNDRVLVSEGQKVAQGELISEMGTTGRSTGPHLHFEIHPSGQGAVNPMAFLPSESSEISQNY